MLRIPPVVSDVERAIRELNALASTCEAAARDRVTAAARAWLLRDSEEIWRAGMTVRLRAGARGEDTQALTACFERLRVSRERLILARPVG
jgi:hypothetical protein